MILMGDERGRSQGGNNNAYCQPGEMNWFDWETDDRQLDFEKFVRGVIRVRQALGLFRADRFLHAGPDVRHFRFARWLRPEGGAMRDEDWTNGENRSTGLLLHESRTFLLIALNASHTDVDFTLPGKANRGWTCRIDTARSVATPDGDHRMGGDGGLTLPARSLQVLETRAGRH